MLAPEGTGGGLPPGVGVGVGVDVSGGNWKGGCPGKGEGRVPGTVPGGHARGNRPGGLLASGRLKGARRLARGPRLRNVLSSYEVPVPRLSPWIQ
jgi:hypothetical protein